MLQPRGVEGVLDALASHVPENGVIASGAGRSYGDAAQNAGGDVLDMTALDRIVSVAAAHGLVTAQAGATLGAAAGPAGRTQADAAGRAGTRHVTLAGAIASDIHGKNHHHDGGLSRHVGALALHPR